MKWKFYVNQLLNHQMLQVLLETPKQFQNLAPDASQNVGEVAMETRKAACVWWVHWTGTNRSIFSLLIAGQFVCTDAWKEILEY